MGAKGLLSIFDCVVQDGGPGRVDQGGRPDEKTTRKVRDC